MLAIFLSSILRLTSDKTRRRAPEVHPFCPPQTDAESCHLAATKVISQFGGNWENMLDLNHDFLSLLPMRFLHQRREWCTSARQFSTLGTHFSGTVAPGVVWLDSPSAYCLYKFDLFTSVCLFFYGCHSDFVNFVGRVRNTVGTEHIPPFISIHKRTSLVFYLGVVHQVGVCCIPDPSLLFRRPGDAATNPMELL